MMPAPIPSGQPGPFATPAPPPPASAPTPPTARRARTWPAILVLYILAALVPESIASSNTPALAYVLKPATLLFLPAFYGSANLLIRELRRRRNLGWASVLKLGAAFGFINEGIVAATWYRVTPTGYVITDGVDWAWAVALTVFHAVFSVVVPILLVELLFPRIAARPWLGNWGITGFTILLALTTSIGFIPARYRPYQVAVLLAVVLLVVLSALLRPAASRVPVPRAVPRLWTLRAAGFAGAFLYFAVIYGVPGILAARVAPQALRGLQLVYIALTLGLFALGVGVVRGWTRRVGWGPRQTLALISGALTPAMLVSLTVLQTRAGGQPVLILPFLVLLIWLAWRTKRQEARHTPPTTAARA